MISIPVSVTLKEDASALVQFEDLSLGMKDQEAAAFVIVSEIALCRLVGQFPKRGGQGVMRLVQDVSEALRRDVPQYHFDVFIRWAETEPN